MWGLELPQLHKNKKRETFSWTSDDVLEMVDRDKSYIDHESMWVSVSEYVSEYVSDAIFYISLIKAF